VVTVATGVTRPVAKSTTWKAPRVLERHTRTELLNSSARRSSGASCTSSTAMGRPPASRSAAAATSTVAAPVVASTRTSSTPPPAPPAAGRASTYERPSRIHCTPGAPLGRSSAEPKMRSTVRRRGSGAAAVGAPAGAAAGDVWAAAGAAASIAANVAARAVRGMSGSAGWTRRRVGRPEQPVPTYTAAGRGGRSACAPARSRRVRPCAPPRPPVTRRPAAAPPAPPS
jgi:hypothetical protein